MKRKLLIKLIILTLIGLCLFWGYYNLGLFTRYNTFSARSDIKNGIVKILIYGELDPNEEIENKVAKSFGFQFERVEDCTITQSFINRVDQYNGVVIKHISQLHGSDWDSKFNEKFKQELEKR